MSENRRKEPKILNHFLRQRITQSFPYLPIITMTIYSDMKFLSDVNTFE